MRKGSITEAKNNCSKLIDGLASGSSVLIVDRGRLVARLELVTSGVAPDDERQARLLRAGLVRPRSGKPARSVLSSPPPQTKGRAAALAALLESVAKGVEGAVRFWGRPGAGAAAGGAFIPAQR